MSEQTPTTPALTYFRATPALWSARDIPGWREDGRLRGFYTWFLHPNVGIDLVEEKRSLLRDRAYARRLRTSLEYLLEQQPATLGTWHAITGYDIHFYGEGELYGFLLDLHAFFFGDRPGPPEDPDPDRPSPPPHWTYWARFTG
ncbi:hypothetical protein ACIRS1_36910 [Kitasatospora sp. NPDC101176]|uniref:hypothetical protein n=1 Tax=Kitasatospora sp. NPDC101176 TaxID=3364099 RepID=UPI00381905F1